MHTLNMLLLACSVHLIRGYRELVLPLDCVGLLWGGGRQKGREEEVK